MVREFHLNIQHAKWKNSFREAYLWIKGELLDLKGMADALSGKELVLKNLAAVENKKRSNINELEKLNAGKATIKTFFKSSNSK